jgi:hypothetical protein
MNVINQALYPSNSLFLGSLALLKQKNRKRERWHMMRTKRKLTTITKNKEKKKERKRRENIRNIFFLRRTGLARIVNRRNITKQRIEFIANRRK